MVGVTVRIGDTVRVLGSGFELELRFGVCVRTGVGVAARLRVGVGDGRP